MIGAIIASVTVIGAFFIRKPADSGEAPAHAGH
jgi:DHA2 family lincomycin resistance protein-like MFS transporter